MADQEGAGRAKLTGRFIATLALKKLYKMGARMHNPPPFPALTRLRDLQKENNRKRELHVLALAANDDTVLSVLQHAAVFLSQQKEP